MIGFLGETDADVAIVELCRCHGFRAASYYLWRGKFGGTSVPDAKRLRESETENARLKKLLGSRCWRMRFRARPCEESGDRTGPAGAGATSRLTDNGRWGPGILTNAWSVEIFVDRLPDLGDRRNEAQLTWTFDTNSVVGLSECWRSLICSGD